MLIVLPWSAFWEQNYFVQRLSSLGPIVSNNFVRGAVSGLGIVNLFAGFAELIPMFAARERHEVTFRDGADTQVRP